MFNSERMSRMFTRRRLLNGAATLAVYGSFARMAGSTGLAATVDPVSPALPSGARDAAVLDALPGKKPLIKRSYRPPNYETPVDTFEQAFTPNDQFFVRWHLSNIPEVDAAEWRLKVGGDGASTPLELSLAQLAADFEQVEIAALCHCAGNRRGLSDPHVMGVQWGYGAMGNATWKGVRLKDILAKAGVTADAIEIAFNGGESGAVEETPDFVKSIPAWKALDDNTMIATHMNGEPLPHWNGYPARLIVPGWMATYWIKQVTDINALTKPQGGYWMEKAYRVPLGVYSFTDRFITQETSKNTPITEMVVNSLITSLSEGQAIVAGKPVDVRGVAWDGGHGITQVDVSTDGGQTWRPAMLGPDLGRFSWRQWSLPFTPAGPGRYAVMARATNAQGASQVSKLIFSPSGYHNNVIHTVNVEAA
jgi:DMSO/TMAO reductase YedYZ molybdopterin-dependent catalytic subunit